MDGILKKDEIEADVIGKGVDETEFKKLHLDFYRFHYAQAL